MLIIVVFGEDTIKSTIYGNINELFWWLYGRIVLCLLVALLIWNSVMVLICRISESCLFTGYLFAGVPKGREL